MSIVRAVIRQCAVAALRQKTWAEERVYDSNNAPLVDALTVGQDGKPYIVVFTDQDNMTDVTDGVYGSVRQLDLTIEMGVACASGCAVTWAGTNSPSSRAGLRNSSKRIVSG